LRRSAAVYRQKWSIGFQKFLQFPNTFTCMINFSHPSSKECNEINTAFPRSSSIHRTATESLPVAAPISSVHLISKPLENTCARRIWTHFPLGVLVYISIQILDSFKFFVLVFKTNQSAQCSGVFASHTFLKSLWSSSSAYSLRTFAACNGFFLSIPSTVGPSNRVANPVRGINVMREIPQVRQNPIDVVTPFNFQYLFRYLKWLTKCEKKDPPIYLLLFCESLVLIQRD